jgi:hypothetical protein
VKRIALLAILLTGCATKDVVMKPSEPIVIDKYVYVPVSKTLTVREDIATGPLSQCPVVAAKRKAAIESCNAKLDAIEQIEGAEHE